MPRQPIKTLEEFTLQHTEQYDQLRRYVTTGRGRHQPDAWLIEALKLGDPRSLKATSHDARIAFAKAAEGQYREPLREAGRPVAFMTLTDVRDARSLSSAADFNINDLQARAADWLHPYTFVAMTEVAYYSNRPLPETTEPTVSWHAHALVWDLPKSEMRSRVKSMNSSSGAFINTRKAAHGRYLAQGEAAGNLLYMLKIPLSDYRVYAMREELINKKTGEITTPHTGRFKQQKRMLRPGDAVKAFNVLHGFELDELSFASDWADEVRCVALRAARASRCREDRARRERNAKLNGEPIALLSGWARFNADQNC